jgi:serine/threonine protein kinase
MRSASDAESDADEGGGVSSASEDEEVARRWQEGSAAGDLEIPVPDFGLGSAAREAAVMAEVGPGGLLASDFQLSQRLARLSVQQVTADASAPNPLMAGSATEVETAAIVIFAGRYYSGMPYEDPATVFLKEYLPGTRPVAVNELAVVHYLMGGQLPAQKWLAAVSPLTDRLPVVPLLGYFEAGISPDGAAVVPDVRPGKQATLWLAFKWEGMQPLALYAATPQQAQPFFWVRRGGAPDRLKMLRAICAGCVRALAFVHERGVAHGSLGSGAVLLSHVDDRKAGQLVVKLDNFGFAQRQALPPDSTEAPWPSQLGEDHPLIAAQREDMAAMAITLLETVFSALAVEPEVYSSDDEGPVGAAGGASAAARRDTSADALGRLVFEVFQRDVRAFRRYAEQEAGWEAPVAFLDEQHRAGWLLIAALVEGQPRAAELVGSPFLDPA